MNPKSSKAPRIFNSSSLVVLVLILLLQQSHLHNLFLVEATTNVHLVYLGEKKHDDPAATKKSHYKMLSDFLGSKEAAKKSMLYSYRHGFSGFAARLTEAQAKAIAKIPGVVKVIQDHRVKLHTTRSWDFLGVHHNSPQNSPLTKNLGKGIIIGVIDTGVWPESESFKDEGMPPIPKRWKGMCQKGHHFNVTNCNNKIIGARWFVKGYLELNNNNLSAIEDVLSPRDVHGHGTHTASTAAGNFVKNANYQGLAAGVARGGAPLAHLAIYKAFWEEGGGGSASDTLKAFDQAIHDDVDIISGSFSTGVPHALSLADPDDLTAVGSFHATAKGITVVAAAGNDGPVSQSVANMAPWTITVAATTIDRAFPTSITLGNNHTFWGQAIYFGKTKNVLAGLTSIDLILADNATSLSCAPGNLNSTLAKGNIVVCYSLSALPNIASASEVVRAAGGVGIVYAQSYNDLNPPCNIPCVKVDFTTATQILNYIANTRSPSAMLSYPRTAIGTLPSPKVATFSSRGPSSLTPKVLKPDVAAPGVDILAAVPGGRYALLSGTSMSCPHVSGIVALIKSIHKDWSPSVIRSALVTTASQVGTDGSYMYAEGPNRKTSDPFDIGGGQVNPEKVLDPGLIYNVTTQDYVRYLCSIGYPDASIAALTDKRNNCNRKRSLALDLNLPSISVPNLRNGVKVTVTRTVTNVGDDVNSVYKAAIEATPGIEITIEPQILRFNSTTKSLPFKINFFSTQKLHGYYKFGSLTWSDGKHHVRSPIAVRVIAFETFSDV